MQSYLDHDIFMKQGAWLMKCHKTGHTTYSIAHINNKVCPDCGKLETIPADYQKQYPETANSLGYGNSTPIPTTTIVCNRCNSVMQQVANGIFYCINGHKKMLMDLVDAPVKEKEEITKRERRIQIKCPYCNKTAEVIEESHAFGKLRRKYSCGHTQVLSLLAAPVGRDERWNDLYPFQRDGVEFVEKANYRAQIGDEMGLGKTIQALATLRYNYNELTPCLIICEASKVYDWKEEFKHWVSDKFDDIPDEPIIHPKGTFGLVPAFKNHIISMSLLQKPKVLDSILKYGFKFMIVDESHSFKNESAERTYALQQIAKNIPYVVFLSGTPIMNNVMEYFVPLNILRPSHFPSKQYIADRCDKAPNGRVLGISNYWRPQFFHRIEEYVIRRTKKDAGIKLPNLRRNKHFVAIDQDKTFVKGYMDLVDELQETMDKMREDAGMNSDILGILAKLRHLTGVAKVKPVIQMVNEFIESTDPEDKIAIGVHHKLVMEWLQKGLSEYNPICVSDESPEVKMNRIREFQKPERRVLIASILGAGQGLNIQFCKNCIVAEREWNPAKEEQFIGRFHRIAKNPDGTLKIEFNDATDSVNADYLNAANTIDEFFEHLVNLKQHVVDATMDEGFAYNTEFLMELCHLLVESRSVWEKQLKGN